jgi:hypothetical protein
MEIDKEKLAKQDPSTSPDFDLSLGESLQHSLITEQLRLFNSQKTDYKSFSVQAGLLLSKLDEQSANLS